MIGSKLELAGSAGVSAREISHPEKMFWPDEGYTKQHLAEYYRRVFPKLSPYVEDRLLTLERCPDGMRGKCFFQKQKPPGMPSGTPTKRIAQVTRTGRFTDYVVGGSLRATAQSGRRPRTSQVRTVSSLITLTTPGADQADC